METSILITIKDKKIRLSLIEKSQERDFLEILEERSLSEKLFPEIDKLLKRNNLKAEDVKKVAVSSDQGETFTTTRIAKAAAQAWNFTRT